MRIHKLWPTWAAAGGLVLIFIGERVIGGSGAERIALSGIGGAAVLAAAIVRFVELAGAPEDRRKILGLLAFSTALVAIGMLLYAPLPLFLSGDGHQKLKGVLWAAWPIVTACGLLPMLMIELAVAPTALTERYEERRVKRAFERGLSLALLLAVVFFVNYLADRHEWKADLTYGKTAQASDATRQVVRDLTKPVKVILFFPRANEVAEALDPYMKSLAAGSSQLTIERVDQALAGQLATDVGVTENGYVAVQCDKLNEKVRIGTTLKNAKSALKTFDTSFAAAVIKVTRPKNVAYFTVGHGERSTDPDSQDTRPSLAALKSQLRANQYDVKPLGIAEGLGAQVPDDATLIFVMGPEKPFSPEETRSLKNALKRGIRILIALESEREGEPMKELLEALGLEFHKERLVNDRAYVRVTQTEADQEYVYTNKYSSHASVTTMTRNASRLATLFAHTGSLDKLATPPAGMRVDMVLNSLDDTFEDRNGNLKMDAGEKRQSFGLAAAVVRTSTTPNVLETRAFVIADVDPFAEPYVRFQGNPYLVADIVYWLRDLKDPVLPNVSEEDVRLVHKKDEDAAWFYSTTLGVPALVLALGFIKKKKGRRR